MIDPFARFVDDMFTEQIKIEKREHSPHLRMPVVAQGKCYKEAYRLLLEEGPMPSRMLAERLGISMVAARNRLYMLKSAGRVEWVPPMMGGFMTKGNCGKWRAIPGEPSHLERERG